MVNAQSKVTLVDFSKSLDVFISLFQCELSPVVLDTNLQSISTDTELRTPYIFKTPVNRLRPAGPLPSATSDSDTMTPGLLNSFNRYEY